MAKESTVEVRDVGAEEITRGVRLRAGHKVVLIIDEPGEKPAAPDRPRQPDQADLPGPPAPTPNDVLDVKIVSAAGAPQRRLEYEVSLPDGTKRAGHTADDGGIRLEGLQAKVRCTLELPDVDAAAAGDPAPGRLRYQPGLALQAGTPATVELPPRVRRGQLTGMHFETAKTFLLPSAMNGIRMLRDIYDSYGADLAVLVSGHTDTQGPADYNRGLSMERADSIARFLQDDVDGWMKWYDAQPCSNPWGVREDQYMLATLAGDDGAPFYPGKVDGQLGTKTQAAYKKFQTSRGLKPTSLPNRDTRRALVTGYMGLERTSLPPGARLASHGCGLFHLAVPTPPNASEPKNRRVEIFLFEGEVVPAPQRLCPSGGCAEYPQWVARTESTVDLDQPPGSLSAKVVDDGGNPVAGAEVHVSGIIAGDRSSGDDGTATFDGLVPGKYKAIAGKAGFAAADVEVEVAPGGSASVTLTLAVLNVKIELLDAGKSAVSEVRFGLFDNAYDPSVSTPDNAPPLIDKLAEADNFVGADSRRFHIRVTDPGHKGLKSVQANLRTFAGGNSLLDEPSPSSAITLLPVAKDSEVFESRGLMLVSDDADRDLPTHCGIDGLYPVPERLRGESDHRVRRGSMFGAVEVEYPAGSGRRKSVPVFRGSEKKRFDVQVFVLRTAPGAAGSLTVAENRIFFHLQKARELYERLGIFLATTAHAGAEAKGDARHTGGLADFFYEIDPALPGPPPVTVNVGAPGQADQIALARAYPQTPNVVRVFFAVGPPPGSGGATFGGNPATPANPQLGCSFVFDSPRPFALAHELGHALGYGPPPTGHFTSPTQPPNPRMANTWNLMDAAGPTPPKQNNRVWDVVDAAGINQLTVFLGSTYLRPL